MAIRKRNPNGSNIPKARELIKEVLAGDHGWTEPETDGALHVALDLMFREADKRKGRIQQRMPITAAMVRMCRALKEDVTLSNADIAQRIGLPACASGRVSEILQGLYDNLLDPDQT